MLRERSYQCARGVTGFAAGFARAVGVDEDLQVRTAHGRLGAHDVGYVVMLGGCSAGSALPLRVAGREAGWKSTD